MTRSTVWLATRIVLWGSAIVAVLSVSRISLPGDHAVCGPWGCGPPVSALIACHGFWVLLMVPPVVALIRHGSPRSVRILGILLISAGIAALTVIAIWEWTHWYATASDWQRRYLVHRYVFSIVTLVDVPVIEITLLGIAGLAASARAHGPR